MINNNIITKYNTIEKLCDLYDEGNCEEIIEMFDLCNKTMDEVIKDLEEVKNGN